MRDVPSNSFDNDIQITFSEKQTEAFVTLTAPKNGNEYKAESVVSLLKGAGVTCGISINTIKKMISQNIYNRPVKVAVGKAPVDGQDGWFEFLFETDIDTKPKILQDGSVDYSAYGNVPTVAENQKIAIYHSAILGTDGESVKGETILAKRGRDLLRLKGKGFYFDEKSKTYYAKHDGRITYVNERLVIEKELVIDGDVSHTTGDVEFQNDIRIKGNVLTGVKITSMKGSIIVDGYVESSTLSAKHNVVLKNGMQGNGKGSIDAGGSVTGKFFEQVRINAGEDVNANAIMNSHIVCGQDVIVSGKYGIIIGGSVKAIRYIKATIIGNMSEVRTMIEAGVSGDLFAQLTKCEKDVAKAEQEVDKINKTLEQINSLLGRSDREDLKQKKIILMRNKIEKDTIINKYTKEKQDIVEKMGKANLAKITIDKVIYPGAVITINGMRTNVDEECHHVEYARRGAGIIVYNIGE